MILVTACTIAKIKECLIIGNAAEIYSSLRYKITGSGLSRGLHNYLLNLGRSYMNGGEREGRFYIDWENMFKPSALGRKEVYTFLRGID